MMATTTSIGALARIAGRDAIRHRRHSLLLAAMIALPVAGLAAGTTLLDTLGQQTGSVWIEMFGSLVVVVFWTLSAITLVAAVLMASAAVTIAARRQLRALGLLAAAGAAGAQLGTVVILQAAALGLAGALVGVPAGLLVARALLPHLAQAMHFPVAEVPLLVTPGRLLLAAGLGLLAAVGAALVPAVRAARQPVTAALAAHQPPPRHPRRLTIAGIMLVLVGLALVVLGVWVSGTPWQPWVAVASVPAVLVGFAALSPALVALVGRTARRLPATGRLAVRDLARHRTRSAATVAAITAALAVPMLLGVQAATSAASERAYAPRELRADQVLADSPAAAAEVTKLLPGAHQAPFTTAEDPGGRAVTVHGPLIDQEHSGVANQHPAIGERELLVAMGGDQAAAAFANGAVVAFGTNLVPDGQVTLAITDSTGPARRIRVPAVEVTTGLYLGQTLPTFVISRQTAQRLGLPGLTTPPHYLVRATRPLSDGQRDQLRALQTHVPGISWAEPDPNQQAFEQGLGPILLALLAVAGMIALGSVAAACALTLSEARPDLTTLGQLGATPAMTRRLMAAQAWLLATLGGLLAAAIALAPVVVHTLANWQVRPRLDILVTPSALAVPWTLLAVVAVGIPALAAAAASLLGRSPAPLTARRGGGPAPADHQPPASVA
jgi:putative ABC transport system permease protein